MNDEMTDLMMDDSAKATTENDTDKKCPSCSGTMEFDPATGGLMCPYCGHTEEIEVRNATKNDVAVAEQDFHAAVETESFDWEQRKRQLNVRTVEQY